MPVFFKVMNMKTNKCQIIGQQVLQQQPCNTFSHCLKENNEKEIKNCNEISKLIKAFPKDIAALDKRSVLAKVNSQGSGTQKPSPGQIPRVGEDKE